MSCILIQIRGWCHRTGLKKKIWTSKGEVLSTQSSLDLGNRGKVEKRLGGYARSAYQGGS